MDKYKLSQSTIEKLGYYVYLLIDPRNNKVFYVGKGKGNRINQHLLGALDKKTNETEKIKRIRDIQKTGKEVKHYILRHELTEEEAFEVECAVIDVLGKDNLTNIVNGHDSINKGIMKLEDIKIKYEAEEVIIKQPTILINIHNLYKKEASPKAIYDATRKSWKVSFNRVSKIKVACSVYLGIIREVYIINKWLPSTEIKGRSMFVGKVAPKDVRNKYLNKSVSKYWKKGSQYPIKYVLA
ncbi:MAG: hypothetical protein NTZ18_04655 [Candidatus Komeilibacteria bacterium]|nr:hypothetical protein [Candidatus Komeilibacteria bacterium]